MKKKSRVEHVAKLADILRITVFDLLPCNIQAWGIKSQFVAGLKFFPRHHNVLSLHIFMSVLRFCRFSKTT